MATKADFSEDEWKALQKGVTGAGMLVSVSERDFTDSFGEATAIAKYLAEQHEKSDSALVRDVANVRRTGFGVTASTQEVEAETSSALRAALETLRAKAPDEVARLPGPRVGRRRSRGRRQGRSRTGGDRCDREAATGARLALSSDQADAGERASSGADSRASEAFSRRPW